MSDFRHALRQLAKSPGFTALAILSLAVGIGINSTIFSLMDAAFLRPLPIGRPEEFVKFEYPRVSYGEYEQLCRGLTTLAGLAASARSHLLVDRGEGIEPIVARVVSPNYFTVVAPGPAAAGRYFAERSPDLRQPIVVISHGLWHRRFAADPAIVGRTIAVNGTSATIVGVAAPGFTGESRLPPTELWCPARSSLDRHGDRRAFDLAGRLAAGRAVEQAQAEAETVFGQPEWRSLEPIHGRRVCVWTEYQSRMDHGGRLTYFMGPIVGLVLLVACANVSCLLLGRYEERRREIAVRLALGAGRLRVMRYLLAEGVLLSAAGAGLGLLFTSWAVDTFPALLPSMLSNWTTEFSLDRRVLGLTAGLAILATLSFGLVPAWRASRLDVSAMLKTDVVHLGKTPSRNVLIVGQVMAAMMFLAIAALFVRGFLAGANQDLGFTERRVLITQILPEHASRPMLVPLLDEVRGTVLRIPGVESVSIANTVFGGRQYHVLTPDDEKTGNAAGRPIGCNPIDVDYFSTLGIPLLHGRDFTTHDHAAGARVAIVSESLAKLLWPGENPVGRTLFAGNPQLQPRQIVGVVRDTALWGERIEIRPVLYLPLRQELNGSLTLLVRTRTAPAAFAAPVRDALRRMDTTTKAVMFETIDGLLRLALMPQWFAAWLGGMLGALAFVLAITGLYSVIAYAVVRRTRELGIRLAMGAAPREAVWLVLRQGLGLASIGVVLGLPIAIAAGMVASRGLYGISPADPIALIGTSLLVIGIAALASWIPARRVAAIDPVDALRSE